MSERTWRAYYPDEGESPDDAEPLPRGGHWRQAFDAESAAEIACEADYSERSGWERGDADFVIAIISPDGAETRWQARHEPSVEHYVNEVSDE